jgi:hypothetical protein
MNVNPDVDRMVVDAVRNVRDRFGVDGLRDLVNLATTELRRAERAAAELAENQQEPTDMGDTQAWMAFTGEDHRR